MKRILCALLTCALVLGCIPGSVMAKQMNNDVPVWTEETVRQYVLDYVEGKSMERLWNYYDLQIRRYMPQQTFEALLTDLEWMTGSFIELGSYRSFEEPQRELKTHVVHLCMEKQDIDVYFTHKDKENDWEVMALEFVPAEEQSISNGSDLLVDDSDGMNRAYSEEEVTVGVASYPLQGVLTLPAGASAETPAPACVLVHDFGAMDRDAAMGKTTLFKDIAELFGRMGIATLRYDKRTFAYPELKPETAWEEVVEDALSALDLLRADERVDNDRIVVVGLGFGAMLAPRIASQADGGFTGMLLIGGSPETVMEYVFTKNKSSLDLMDRNEAESIRNVVRKITSIKEDKARAVEMFGHNGYYFWEMAQYDAIKLIKKLAIPAYIVQGRNDATVSEEDGCDEYKSRIGYTRHSVTYESFRGLNHLLMNDLTTNVNGECEYAVETHLDTFAGRRLANWVLNLNQGGK